ncbi:hypothetical protein ANO11243_026630 [Dothideomycetidae sp. 11243]|nr:hypothetical protein ANO11243_026630 [fungal sp. No.11243]
MKDFFLMTIWHESELKHLFIQRGRASVSCPLGRFVPDPSTSRGVGPGFGAGSTTPFDTRQGLLFTSRSIRHPASCKIQNVQPQRKQIVDTTGRHGGVRIDRETNPGFRAARRVVLALLEVEVESKSWMLGWQALARRKGGGPNQRAVDTGGPQQNENTGTNSDCLLCAVRRA